MPTLIPGRIGHEASTGQIEHIAALIPDEWLEPATCAPEQCLAGVRKEFDCGADPVNLHGGTPVGLEPVVPTYHESKQ